LSPERLHIQVQPDHDQRKETDHDPGCDAPDPDELFHEQTLRSLPFKKRPKPSVNNTVVILNPAANSDRARRTLSRVQALAENCMICTTSAPGEAEILTRHAIGEGFSTIVAAGGDGTIHEVVNGMAGTNATLGLLPIGSVNVFAMELGLPSNDLDFCWNVIRGSNTRVVDLPSANDKYFVQLAGVGLDAQVVKETSANLKRNFGPVSYLISAAQIATRKPPRLFIESSESTAKEGSFVLIGNGRRYGGPFPFFKQAVIDDGLLDVIVFKQLGYLEIIRYLQDVFFSSQINLPEVEYFQTRKIRVTSEQEVPVELDGELVGTCPVEFQMRERTLRVLAPAAE
jgi:YegS/Rv2252/BmrU family lipid kinase